MPLPRVGSFYGAIRTAHHRDPGLGQGREWVGPRDPGAQSLGQPLPLRGNESRLDRGGDPQSGHAIDGAGGQDRSVLDTETTRIGTAPGQDLEQVQHPVVGQVPDRMHRHRPAHAKTGLGHLSGVFGIQA